jgi:hypothetical protein
LFTGKKCLFLVLVLLVFLLFQRNFSVFPQVVYHLLNDWVQIFEKLCNFKLLEVNSEPEREHHLVFEVRLAFRLFQIAESLLQVSNLFVKDVLQSWVFNREEREPNQSCQKLSAYVGRNTVLGSIRQKLSMLGPLYGIVLPST